MTQPGWNLQVAAYANIFGGTDFYGDYVTAGDTLIVNAQGPV